MPKILRRLRLDEISLVDAPANPLARVMLAKREDPAKKEKKSVSDTKKTAAAADIADLEKMLEELKKSSEGGAGDEGDLTPESRTLRRMVLKVIEDRKTAVFVKKAEALKGLPGVTVAKLAPLMKEIAEKAPDAWDQLEPLLKNWQEAFETSELFSEKGSSGADGATAEDRATKLAHDRISKGEAKDLGAALALVFKADPALYREYRKETQFKVGVGSRA
jgi:hypothetical protein